MVFWLLPEQISALIKGNLEEKRKNWDSLSPFCITKKRLTYFYISFQMEFPAFSSGLLVYMD